MRTRVASLILGSCLALGTLSATSGPALALDPYDVPVISCEGGGLSQIMLKICGGEDTGAPAGVSIHYKKVSDYNVSGWDDDGTLCKLSLSGQPSLQHPGASRWELGPGQCQTVIIGDINFDETGVSGNECSVEPLECGTDYVFRVFAHAGRRMGRSDFSENLYCSTLPCESGCTYTQGYWKTHGPGDCVKGQNDNEWPVAGLSLGNVAYSDLQLCAILQQPAGGNGLLTLAHQLIAAKLNVANGAGSGCIAGLIASADAIIGNLVVPPVGGGSLPSSSTSALTMDLDYYNNGDPAGSCDSEHCPSGIRRAKPGSAMPEVKSTWGRMKTIYR